MKSHPSQEIPGGEKAWTLERMLLPLKIDCAKHAGKPGSGALEDIWSAALATGRHGELPKQAGCFRLSQSGCLGPYLRWLCVLAMLVDDSEVWASTAKSDKPGAKGTGDTSRLAGVLARFSGAPAEAIKVGLSTAMHFGGKDSWMDAGLYEEPREWNLALLGYVSELRRRHKAPDVSMQEFLTARVLQADEPITPEAFVRFQDWLRTGFLSARSDLSRLRCECFLTAHKDGTESLRERQVCDVVGGLSRQPRQGLPGGVCTSAAHPLINVWSEGSWTGLRAFATRVLMDFRAAGRAPAAKTPGPALLYIPLSRGLSEGARLSPNEVAVILREAFGLYARHRGPEGVTLPDDLSDRPSNAGPNDLSDDLSDIRQALTAHPTLIVFDAIETSSKPFDALLDFVRNANWVAFIRSLIQPHLDGLRRTGGEYCSRFLALSERPLNELGPWLPDKPIRLEDLPDARLLGDLVSSDSQQSSVWAEELRLAVRRLWGSDPRGPRADGHGSSLAALYALPQGLKLHAEVLTSAFPSEVDLSVAWCAQKAKLDVRAVAQEAPPAAARVRILHAFLYGDYADPAASLALQFIALSLDGLRLGTLRRCLRAFRARERSLPVRQAIDTFVANLGKPKGAEGFFEAYRPLVVLSQDDSWSTDAEQSRWFNLESPLRKNATESRQTDPRLLDLRLDGLRELFLAELAGAASTEPKQARGAFGDRFERIQRILAEESLAQATAAVRIVQASRDSDHLAMRRYVQAAMHGLLSLRLEGGRVPEIRADRIAARGRLGSLLPENAYKRYVFLYKFVFRRCIENAPDWHLARSYGRNDVRLALLSIFLNPGWARRVLGVLHETPASRRGYTDFGAFGHSATVPGFGKAFDPHSRYLAGQLGIDVFKAMLRSANRAGPRTYAMSAGDIGRDLASRPAVSPASTSTPPGQAPVISSATTVSSLLRLALAELERCTQEEEGSYPLGQPLSFEQLGFKKIAIDAMQAHDADAAARDLCLELLAQLGVPEAQQQLKLGEVFFRTDVQGAALRKSAFERGTLQPRFSALLARIRSGEHLEVISDIYLRLGELVATSADHEDTTADLDGSLCRFLDAYALFWLGDRLRSEASMDLGTNEWPVVSARAMRYYVRVALKIAKLLGKRSAQPLETQEKTRCAEGAQEFYVHARKRIDVYTRHLFRFQAERISIALLLAAAARVRGSLAMPIDGQKRSQSGYVEHSLDLINSVEPLLMGMGLGAGGGDGMAKRFLLERIKTLRKLVNDGKEIEVYERMIDRDLKVLTKMARANPYWQRILESMLKKQK